MRISPIFLRYDYGIRERGDSLELTGFYGALEALGHELHPFWYDDYLVNSRRDELQEKVLEFISDVRPELAFFIIMKDEFTTESLDAIGTICPTVNWFCDDQWRFDDFTSRMAPHFTYCVTTDRFTLMKYRAIGYKKVIRSQWAALTVPAKVEPADIDYEYEVSFVGGANPYRQWLISRLRKEGFDVRCFGHGWKDGRLDYEGMGDIFRKSRINLNLSNSASLDLRYVLSSPRNAYDALFSKKRAEQIKARNFEIPGFGGFQLTGYVPGLEEYFKIGEEIAAFNDIEDLLHQIGYYLDNESERAAITSAGFTRTGREHTYMHRLRDVLGFIVGGHIG